MCFKSKIILQREKKFIAMIKTHFNICQKSLKWVISLLIDYVDISGLINAHISKKLCIMMSLINSILVKRQWEKREEPKITRGRKINNTNDSKDYE